VYWITVLTHLTCASLTEDRFGVVQRDIPRVLEALLAFLGAVEDARAGLRLNAGGGTVPEKERTLEQRRAAAIEAADLEEARAVLGEVGDGESVCYIACCLFRFDWGISRRP
jgi:nucleoporin NDC1